MMISKAWLLALGAICAWPGLAAAQEVFPARTVGDLATICSGGPGGDKKAAAENFCYGYAQGILSLTLDQTPKPFCLPAHPPTRAATMSDFVTWSKASEERRGLPAAKGLVQFFTERFPCPK
jgi:hypothetical protein